MKLSMSLLNCPPYSAAALAASRIRRADANQRAARRRQRRPNGGQDLRVRVGRTRLLGVPKCNLVRDDRDARQTAQTAKARRPNFDVDAAAQADRLGGLGLDERLEKRHAFEDSEDVVESDGRLLRGLGET